MATKLIRAGFAALLTLACVMPAHADYVGAQPGGGQINIGAFAPTINGVIVQITKSAQVDPVTGLAINPATDAKLEAVRALLAAPAPISGNVGGYTSVAVASFARPANTTAYTAGQLVANTTTAGSVTPLSFTPARVNGGSGSIRRARVTKSSPGLTSAAFDVLLYKPTSAGACPTSAAGDGAAYSTDSALLYIGRIPVVMDMAFTDGAKGIGTPVIGSEIAFDAPAGYQTLCGFVRAAGAYTPVSGETFTVALEVFPN